MEKCSIRCPLVRKQLRAAIDEAPWLVDKAFPQRKVVDPKLPVTKDTSKQDEPERVQPVVEFASIQEPKSAEKAPMVQELIAISEKTTEQDDKEMAELIAERITIKENRIDEDEIDWTTPLTKRDEPKRVIEPVDVQEPKVVQEVTIVEQPIVTLPDRDNEKIEVAETRKPVVDEIVKEQKTKQIPVANEKAEIDRATAPVKFELEPKADVEPHLPQETEEDDDYTEFIDEELQKSLPTVTAKQIPKEEKEAKAIRREKIPIEDVEINRKELAESPEEPYRLSVQDENGTPDFSMMEAMSREPARVSAPVAAEDACDDMCPLIKEQKERIMRKLEERQRIVDHYYLTKGFSYFEDVCTCSLACVLYTLSRDRFVSSIFASLVLFAVGLKLCSELDAWEMPRRVS